MKKLAALGIFILSLTFILPSTPARQAVILVVAGHVHQDETGDCPQPGHVYFESDPVRLGTMEFREKMDEARTKARTYRNCNAHIRIQIYPERD